MRSFLRKIPSLLVIAVLSIASSVLLAADLPSVSERGCENSSGLAVGAS